MSIQPMTGRDLMNLPEAQRTKNWVKAYCAQELFTARGNRRADRVTDLGGIVYEVHKVQFWDSSGNTIAPHWYLEMAEVNPS
jgi:hypothetical protein